MIEALFQVAPHTGYVYPNETVVPWGILIVFYPYVTGLVAGSFTISSLYHVFGVQAFKPIARFALLTSLSFMVFVPTFLLSHLGHPERAFNAVITPHLTSAFAAFGYIAGFYMIILMLEVWFAFRTDIVHRAKALSGWRHNFYHLLALGSLDTSKRALTIDKKWIWGLAIIGIPSAFTLHGYVGFVFGSLKSREWWASDLMPVIFIGSAIVSGIAILILLYAGICRYRRFSTDEACMRGLMYTLWGFLIFTVVLEFLEFSNMMYKGREGIDMILALINGPIHWGMLLQLITSLTTLLILGSMIYRRTTAPRLQQGLISSAILMLIAVFAMRWNVIIGGQELSKSLYGLIYYTPPLLGREGLLWSLSLFTAPFFMLGILFKIFTPYEITEHSENNLKKDHHDSASLN